MLFPESRSTCRPVLLQDGFSGAGYHLGLSLPAPVSHNSRMGTLDRFPKSCVQGPALKRNDNSMGSDVSGLNFNMRYSTAAPVNGRSMAEMDTHFSVNESAGSALSGAVTKASLSMRMSQ